MEIPLGNWLVLAAIVQLCRCYRLLYLPGLLDEPKRRYVMNFDGELSLAGPTLQGIANMYVVVHRRRLLFYTSGVYYGFGLGDDRVNVRLVPAGLVGGVEFLDQDAHSGIEYFKKSLADEPEQLSPAKVKRWDSWSRSGPAKIKSEETSVVHEEEISSGYGGRSAVKRTAVEERAAIAPPRQPRFISAKEKNIVRTGFHGAAERGPRWEERTVHREEKVGLGANARPADGRYVLRKGPGHPVEEVNEVEETVVGRDGKTVSTEHDVEVHRHAGGMHPTDPLVDRLQSLLDQMKHKEYHPPLTGERMLHRDDIESDSDMAEKVRLDVTVHTLNAELKTFYLKSKSNLCMTLYRDSFIMAECSNAAGQVFKLDDAAQVAQRLRKRPQASLPKDHKMPRRTEWRGDASPRHESSDDMPEDTDEGSGEHYGNDQRYDGQDWDLAGGADTTPVDSDEALPEHGKAGQQSKGGKKKGGLPAHHALDGHGNNLDKWLGLDRKNKHGGLRAPITGMPTPKPSGPSPIPKRPAGGKWPAPVKSRGNDSYILDKLEEVLDKNTF